MVLENILVLAITFIIVVIATFIRFKGSELFNKWVLVIASFLVIEIYGLLIGSLYFGWAALLFIGMTVICFGLVGGLLSSALISLQLQLYQNESAIYLFVSFLVFAISLFFISKGIRSIKFESDRRLSSLLHNSKQLNVFREVSLSMQQTLHLEKLLQTILTSVTAGHGLGFNRAMILLMEDEGKKLRGKMGTGPMTVEEGFATWEEISRKKYELKELIQIKETEEATDRNLNDRIKRLEISLDQSSFLLKALDSGTPLHIKEFDQHDKTLMEFVREFTIIEMAVFPLINQGNKVGVLIIDNPVNKRPIADSDIDSVIPLANQAAIAIHHAHLYKKIEDMALKDGLTGLLNQRAFESKMEEYCRTECSEQFSLMMIDIDSFKHFNDTNGHLLGNQVLTQTAKVINDTLAEGQFAFRFGGEEFIVLLPNSDIEYASLLAEKIRENVELTNFPCGETQPLGRLTVSIGAASNAVRNSIQVQELLDTADKALYEAKRTGRNRVVIDKGVRLS
ncbi:GGDEF domain-containing protein [Ornithinibacillus xuwenensis]|uniref:Sensor domain-containing diguanylate cyclase n=1 Tax=Ornithinibacillus xuwenensis TaxID=3144668 RepID=A0ABU9XF78_9BACI